MQDRCSAEQLLMQLQIASQLEIVFDYDCNEED